MAKKRKITAEDLYRMELVTHCEISPDGRYVVYALQRAVKKGEKKYQNLWLAPTAGGSPRQFTYGDQVDRQPHWSPDGKQIAFLSNRGDEEQPQLYLLPVDGGEARPLTEMKGSFGEIKWSPDNKQLLVHFTKKDKEVLEREADEEKKELGVVSRHITRTYYKYDGVGYLPKERPHLWLVNARSGKAKQLTDHQIFAEADGNWSPDGSLIVFRSNRSPDPDHTPEAMALYIIPAEGGEMRKLNAPDGSKGLPAFSPDGKWVAFFGVEGRDWYQNNRLWITPVDGSAAARDLTGRYDIDASADTINDTYPPHPMPPTWSKDGGRIYFQCSRHGNTLLKAVMLESGEVEDVVNKKGVVGAYTFDDQQKRLAYFFGGMEEIGQIIVRDLHNNTERQLSDLNKWLKQVDLGKVEEIWFKAHDDYDLHGWILKPPGFRSDRTYPSILEIHGGPLTQYGNYFMHEFYSLAAQGYVVYFCNPRGGQGYGEAHAKAIWGNWGTYDFDDVMAWADHMQQQPYIDPQRMGVTGGSYGGFMTGWIIGHTGRFKAAVAQRTVTNQINLWGASDLNWVFEIELGNKPPWQDFEHYWQQSPMKYLGNAKTPTLVIHSEKDMRCDITQGEQLYVALKYLGVDTELVLFPEEPHGLSRVGRTDRRVERLQHIVRWFDKYLK